MSVLLVTNAGDIVIDLYIQECPIACNNFLKLCASKYYHQSLIYNIQQNYLVQMGDPTGTGKGGNSIYGIVQDKPKAYFKDELYPVQVKKGMKVGYVGFAHVNDIEDTNLSQFFITLRSEDMDYLLKHHSIFGEVVEGFDILSKFNQLYCDADGRPYQDVRILHTYILDDPLPDVDGLTIPPDSPIREYPPEEKIKRRIPYDESEGKESNPIEEQELNEQIKQKEAKSRAVVLEMIGDLPDADIKPPDEVLFICKLNPVTRDEDLELIFSRFGTIKSCEIIRDHKTGDSLNYAFIEFETEQACIEAYEKMNNVLIDDRRIKVDFSQSVSKLWNRFALKPKLPKAIKKEDPEINKPSYYQPQPQSVPPRIKQEISSNHNKFNNHHNKDSRDRKDYKSDRDRKDSRERERDRPRERRDSRDREKRDRNDRDERRDRDSKKKDYDRERDRDRERNREKDRERSRDKERDRDRDRGRERDYPRDRERERDRPRDKDNRKRSRSR